MLNIRSGWTVADQPAGNDKMVNTEQNRTARAPFLAWLCMGPSIFLCLFIQAKSFVNAYWPAEFGRGKAVDESSGGSWPAA